MPKDLPVTDGWRHIAAVFRYSFIATCVCIGCGSTSLELPRLPALPIRGTLVVEHRPASTIYLDELNGAIQHGLGHFLQQVDLRAVTRQDDLGRQVFVGFEILSLRPAAAWLSFDFAPGDIVTKIDGVSVEHYDAVIPMFEGLIAKRQFDVALIRSGERRSVVIAIRDRRSDSASTSSPPIVTP